MANSGSGENIGSVLAGAAGSALSSLPAAFAQERQQTLDNIITTMNLQRQIQAEELQQQQSLRQEQQATRQQAQFEQQTLINTANLERLTINNSLADINLRKATEFSLLDPAGKATQKQEAAFAEAEATLDQVLGDVPGLANMDFSQKLIAVDELDRQGLKLDFGDIGLSFTEPKLPVAPKPPTPKTLSASDVTIREDFANRFPPEIATRKFNEHLRGENPREDARDNYNKILRQLTPSNLFTGGEITNASRARAAKRARWSVKYSNTQRGQLDFLAAKLKAGEITDQNDNRVPLREQRELFKTYVKIVKSHFKNLEANTLNFLRREKGVSGAGQ